MYCNNNEIVSYIIGLLPPRSSHSFLVPGGANTIASSSKRPLFDERCMHMKGHNLLFSTRCTEPIPHYLHRTNRVMQPGTNPRRSIPWLFALIHIHCTAYQHIIRLVLFPSIPAHLAIDMCTTLTAVIPALCTVVRNSFHHTCAILFLFHFNSYFPT